MCLLLTLFPLLASLQESRPLAWHSGRQTRLPATRWPGAAGVALAGAAAEELAVDAPGLVPLGGDHVQAADARRRPGPA